LPTADRLVRVSGGRTWWAHFEFTRTNIEPIIPRKKIEERRAVCAFRVRCEDGRISLDW
jgi:hypothetical protein